MYPLKFKPILKSTIWGGEKIIPFKHLDIQQEQVGKSRTFRVMSLWWQTVLTQGKTLHRW